MKFVLPLLVLIALGGGFFYFLISPKLETSQEIYTSSGQQKEQISSDTAVDFSASFAIFTEGTFRIFSDQMYHNLSNDAYIEPSNPNIVRVKKDMTTWDDFFKTLPFKLSKDCLITGIGQTFCTGERGTLKFYLNGIENKNALSQIINSGDQLLVSFGNEKEAQIQQQIQQIPKNY